MVSYRGNLPAEVVFTGEAPGDVEDVLSEPFAGPAGRFFDRNVLNRIDFGVMRWCIVNLVGCFPADAKKTDDHRPPEEAIRACAPRLCELIDMAKPKLLVAVGALAKEWLDPQKQTGRKLRASLVNGKPNELYPFVHTIPQVAIRHPAGLLPGRMNMAQSSLEARRCVVTVQSALRELAEGG